MEHVRNASTGILRSARPYIPYVRHPATDDGGGGNTTADADKKSSSKTSSSSTDVGVGICNRAKPKAKDGTMDKLDESGDESGDNGDMHNLLVDLVLSEIQSNMTRIDRENEAKYKESMQASSLPDYRWLMDYRLRSGKKTLGFKDCLDIELLCAKLNPSEWPSLLKEWRQRVRYVDRRDDVVEVFRAAVNDILAVRLAANEAKKVDSSTKGNCTSHSKLGATGRLTSISSATVTLDGKDEATTAVGDPQHHQCMELSVLSLGGDANKVGETASIGDNKGASLQPAASPLPPPSSKAASSRRRYSYDFWNHIA